MRTANEIFLGAFERINSAEECPCGTNLLVWDGCDFSIDWVDVCADSGSYFFSNGTEAIAYLELPQSEQAEAWLGDGE